ncbi:hypothetical protein N5P37_005157 [Trichoderma harzianum]|nr:hypothetical protein N5P37_005157 [Trichoderma harzianum]PKK49033.1 hypothetical protein CI102_8164 [Trichoderma harzianum]
MVHIVSLVTVDVTETEIMQQCEKEIGKKCSMPDWRYYKHGEEVILPNSTAAILIEVSKASAQVRLFHYGTTVTFLKTVAPLQYNLHTAIVPWEQGLGFICFGENDSKESVKVCKIGIVKVV